MIPLSWFLFAWIALAVVFCFLSLLTLSVHLRYGLAGFMTYLSTLLFAAVTILTFWSVGAYLQTTDWTQSIDVTPIMRSWFSLP